MTFTRLLLSIVFLATIAVVPVPVEAQSEYWHETFGDQTAVLLESPDPAIQAEAMRVAIMVAERDGDHVNLLPAAPALLTVYQTSPLVSHRLMAVSALSKIDDERSYQVLLESALNEADDNVRRIILHASADSKSIVNPRVATAYNVLLARDARILARKALAMRGEM